MAKDIYANNDLENGKRVESINIAGNNTITMISKFKTAADDGNGSIYRLFEVGANMIPISIKVMCEAGSASTDYDLGIFEGSKGKAIDADKLADGLSLSTAKGVGSELNGLGALGIADIGKKIYELAGATEANKATGYEIGLTANTASTTAINIVVIATFAQG